MQTELENYQASVIRAFFDKEGKLKNIPSQKKKSLLYWSTLSDNLMIMRR